MMDYGKKPSLMDPDDDEQSSTDAGGDRMYAVFEEFRKRFLDPGSKPEEAMDALMGMCHLAQKAHGEDDDEGKPALAIHVG